MQTLELPIQGRTFVWALGALCQFHRTPFDPNLVLQQFPPPYQLGSLLRAVQALGFKAALKTSKPKAMRRLVLPCLAVLKGEATGADPPTVKRDAVLTDTASSPSPPDDTSYGLALIVKTDGERVLLLEAGRQTPAVLSAAEFDARFTGDVILAAPEDKPATDPDAPNGAAALRLRLVRARAAQTQGDLA